jgi:tRNA dimethylallyltransferase
MKKLIAIAGPTASGKTAFAVQLAQKLATEIISTDSRQFYKELSIGTAKPTVNEMNGVKHHFIDSHSIHTPLTVGQYEIEALDLLNTLFKKYDTVICVGGSGMFLKAITDGTHQFPHSPSIQEKLQQEVDLNGLDSLLKELKQRDIDTFSQVDKENPARVIRALEICMITNEKLSELKKKNKGERNFSSSYYILDHRREVLYDRINKRVDLMLENGLIDEVKKVYPFRNLQTLNTVGYKELFTYLDSEISLEEAIELIKRNTRRYAKRQLTWFRSLPDATWLQPPFQLEEIDL